MTNDLDTRASGDRRRSRAYLVEFGIGMAAYFVLLAAAIPLASAAPVGPMRGLLALLPLAAVAWVAVAVVRHLHRIDERQRLQTLEGLGVGFVVAMLTAVALGLLAPFGLTVPASPWCIYAAGMLAWLISSIVQRSR